MYRSDWFPCVDETGQVFRNSKPGSCGRAARKNRQIVPDGAELDDYFAKFFPHGFIHHVTTPEIRARQHLHTSKFQGIDPQWDQVSMKKAASEFEVPVDTQILICWPDVFHRDILLKFPEYRRQDSSSGRIGVLTPCPWCKTNKFVVYVEKTGLNKKTTRTVWGSRSRIPIVGARYVCSNPECGGNPKKGKGRKPSNADKEGIHYFSLTEHSTWSIYPEELKDRYREYIYADITHMQMYVTEELCEELLKDGAVVADMAKDMEKSFEKLKTKAIASYLRFVSKEKSTTDQPRGLSWPDFNENNYCNLFKPMGEGKLRFVASQVALPPPPLPPLNGQQSPPLPPLNGQQPPEMELEPDEQPWLQPDTQVDVEANQTTGTSDAQAATATTGVPAAAAMPTAASPGVVPAPSPLAPRTRTATTGVPMQTTAANAATAAATDNISPDNQLDFDCAKVTWSHFLAMEGIKASISSTFLSDRRPLSPFQQEHFWKLDCTARQVFGYRSPQDDDELAVQIARAWNFKHTQLMQSNAVGLGGLIRVPNARRMLRQRDQNEIAARMQVQPPTTAAKAKPPLPRAALVAAAAALPEQLPPREQPIMIPFSRKLRKQDIDGLSYMDARGWLRLAGLSCASNKGGRLETLRQFFDKKGDDFVLET
ncbi:expressed unknown protein [Seminavis robusta]|uniref:Uncharacterized protein n=1 Tax=Seminavis robusta TaxID=568900 RepID=A0A9N8HCV6_9STRA|nr:expressed unknown protein [Seminavis robusta]|eukprot:Sro235_g094620.1 n/a (653) ;mRNA; f:7303-9261